MRAACELRDAAFIVDDIRPALQHRSVSAATEQRGRDLEGLVDGRRWWQQRS
ncbi:hypothetical protein [Catellatospora chokoriensis]|uniref:hypothetical protein n=1 Tax=Catellatospora chokoriensis TaxID=310353 RepID=UPI00178365F6|nr:hypothetical protein [Catellatospora chokoriensis]